MDIAQVPGLLKRANKRGIKVAFNNNELSVLFPKDTKVDPQFLAELKENKEHLVTYFKNYYDNTRKVPGVAAEPGDVLEQDGHTYYAITRFHDFWVDEEDAEFKEKLRMMMRLDITGTFCVDSFKKAFTWLLERHESLRATFHKIGNQHWMRIEPVTSPLFEIEVSTLEEIEKNNISIDGYTYFSGHFMDLKKGPNIAVRILLKNSTECHVTFKMHHVIYDAWSVEVLKRDLETAYAAFYHGKAPHVRPLVAQYQDYMRLINHGVRRNSETDRQYWKSTLQEQWPGELLIPGAKRIGKPPGSRVGKVEKFDLPARLAQTLTSLTAKYATGTFNVIQAIFNSYLYRITGQHDLVFGTLMFCREDMEGAEEQIGYYSRMNLIRTVLAPGDKFEVVIRKVIRSNDDTRVHSSFPLIEVMKEMLPPDQHIRGSFWKIDMQYSDMKGYVDKTTGKEEEELPFSINRTVGTLPTEDINSDMKLEFIMLNNNLKLKVIYDIDEYDYVTIESFVNGLVEHIDKYVS
jgi:hypothetical protein